MTIGPYDHLGMSDDQFADNIAAQQMMKDAIAAMRAAINYTNDASGVVTISALAFEAFLHDEVPDMAFWDEKLVGARRV